MSRITGLGLVLPGFLGKDAYGLRLDGPAWSDLTLFEPPEGAPALAGEAPEYSLKDLGVSVKSYLDRTTSLALAACALALDARRDESMGLAFATRWGCLASMKLFYAKVRQNPRVAPPLPFSHSYVNSPAAVLAIEFGLKGFHTVYSHEKSCALSALIAAAVTAEESGAPVVAVAADSLGPERFALYLGKEVLGPPGEETPERFIPAEGSAALVVEKDGEGPRIASWARLGTADAQTMKEAFEARLDGMPRLVYTDAATHEAARRYEEALPDSRFRHLGLSLGEADAALPLAACACACAAEEPVLCVSGDVSGPIAVKIDPGSK